MLSEKSQSRKLAGSHARLLSRVWLFAAPWTAAHQAPLCLGFSRQEHWSGLPFPPPGDLPHPGIDPPPPACPALAGGFFTTAPPGKPTQNLTRSTYITLREWRSYREGKQIRRWWGVGDCRSKRVAQDDLVAEGSSDWVVVAVTWICSCTCDKTACTCV